MMCEEKKKNLSNGKCEAETIKVGDFKMHTFYIILDTSHMSIIDNQMFPFQMNCFFMDFAVFFVIY